MEGKESSSKKRNSLDPESDKHEEPVTLKLEGEAGRRVAENLGKLSAGTVTVDELGAGYFISDDGALGVVVDEETFRKLP